VKLTPVINFINVLHARNFGAKKIDDDEEVEGGRTYDCAGTKTSSIEIVA